MCGDAAVRLIGRTGLVVFAGRVMKVGRLQSSTPDHLRRIVERDPNLCSDQPTTIRPTLAYRDILLQHGLRKECSPIGTMPEMHKDRQAITANPQLHHLPRRPPGNHHNRACRRPSTASACCPQPGARLEACPRASSCQRDWTAARGLPSSPSHAQADAKHPVRAAAVPMFPVGAQDPAGGQAGEDRGDQDAEGAH